MRLHLALLVMDGLAGLGSPRLCCISGGGGWRSAGGNCHSSTSCILHLGFVASYRKDEADGGQAVMCSSSIVIIVTPLHPHSASCILSLLFPRSLGGDMVQCGGQGVM